MTGLQLKDYDIEISVHTDADGLIDSGLVLGDILYQNQALILAFQKGDLKSDVSVGAGIGRMVLDNERLTWEREIREQLEMDGQRVESVRITGKEIIIQARY
jgi:hypothetical protein